MHVSHPRYDRCKAASLLRKLAPIEGCCEQIDASRGYPRLSPLRVGVSVLSLTQHRFRMAGSGISTSNGHEVDSVRNTDGAAVDGANGTQSSFSKWKGLSCISEQVT